MKIAVIGGGPGGLYFSILTKKALPDCQIDVFERNKSDDSFGFGVVFSDETLSEFLTRDPKSYELIRSRFAYWDELDVARDGQKVRITGNGFCGCSRKTLLQLLHQRCREEGVNLHFEHEANYEELSPKYDFVVAADGIGSLTRSNLADKFGTKVQLQKNRFVWLGSSKPLDAFTYFFRNTEHGPMVAHTYQYEEGMSTWIFECSDETWNKWGFQVDNEADTIKKISEIYKEELDGHGLITNKSHWRQFPHVTNTHWHYNNIVLLGDSKATAHFSIGSGTKLAMESAIGLSDAIVAHPTNRELAFAQYEKSRRNRVEVIQHAANVSLDWFEHMDRNIQHPFYQFAFGVMTRAKKVTYENLQLRDKTFTDKVLHEFIEINHFDKKIKSAAFTSFTLRKLKLENRIVMSPMGQYSAQNGLVNDWHLMHYGSRATQGIGLIVAEMTAISPNGRITEFCAGIYTEEQTHAWKRIVDFVHQNSSAKIGIQLGHSGRKGAVKKPLSGNYEPIENPWPLVSASAIAFNDQLAVPKALDQTDMDRLTADFVQAAKNADNAGIDMIELQAHHGFLLGSFLSPLTNIRTDEFGGNIQNRLKFPLRVFSAIRAAFNPDKPISVRISAHDWAPGGINEADVVAISQAFKAAGADIISVSTGLTVANQQPQSGRMWQVPFSDLVRNEAHIPTITAGSVQDIDQINTIILGGKADLVGLGKPLLMDPGFVRNAQAHEGFDAQDVPFQYNRGKLHLYPLKLAERKSTEGMKRALKPESHKKTDSGK